MRKIALFAAQFIPIFIVLVLLYPLILPLYQGLLLGVANPVARGFSPPLHVETIAGGGWRIFRMLPGGEMSRVFSIPGSSLEQVHLGLALLPALLLATPVPWLVRLRLLGLGMAVLYVVQVATFVLLAWAWVRYQRSDPGNLLYSLITMLHSTGGQFVPVVVWGALTSRHWLPGLVRETPADPQEGPRRNDPCPCGSGRKYKHCCLDKG